MSNPAPFRTERRVEFRDTDAAGIMHFSTVFTYMEEVEHEFLRALGTSVLVPLDKSPTEATGSHGAGGAISWPRVAAECQYHGAARFEERLQFELRVRRLGTSSITYEFHCYVGDRHIATGSLTSVCCQLAPDQPPQSIPIPAALREKLSAWLTR